MDDLDGLLQQGFILYQKNGKIGIEASPTFGSVTLHFQDGRFSHLVRTETKKYSISEQPRALIKLPSFFGVLFVLVLGVNMIQKSLWIDTSRKNSFKNGIP